MSACFSNCSGVVPSSGKTLMPMLQPMLSEAPSSSIGSLSSLRIRRAHTRQAAGHDHEFVAAHAHHQILPSDTGTQTLGDGLQQPVADAVPLRVIDVLEVIEVDVQQRQPRLVTLDAR